MAGLLVHFEDLGRVGVENDGGPGRVGKVVVGEHDGGATVGVGECPDEQVVRGVVAGAAEILDWRACQYLGGVVVGSYAIRSAPVY